VRIKGILCYRVHGFYSSKNGKGTFDQQTGRALPCVSACLQLIALREKRWRKEGGPPSIGSWEITDLQIALYEQHYRRMRTVCIRIAPMKTRVQKSTLSF